MAFVRAGIAERFNVYHVEVLVHAPADTVRTRIGEWASVTAEENQRCRFRMHTDTLDWPTMALGVLAADFEIVSPTELAEHVREWADRFNAATRVPE